MSAPSPAGRWCRVPASDGTPGLAGIEAVLAGSLVWLARPGAVVVELAPHQAGAAVRLARGLGYEDVSVELDLAGRSRILVARFAACGRERRAREPRAAAAWSGRRRVRRSPTRSTPAGSSRLPWVGGYCLAAREDIPAAEARLAALVADPEGPHFAVGELDAARRLTSGWTDELDKLLERCLARPARGVRAPGRPSAGRGS